MARVPGGSRMRRGAVAIGVGTACSLALLLSTCAPSPLDADAEALERARLEAERPVAGRAATPRSAALALVAVALVVGALGVVASRPDRDVVVRSQASAMPPGGAAQGRARAENLARIGRVSAQAASASAAAAASKLDLDAPDEPYREELARMLAKIERENDRCKSADGVTRSQYKGTRANPVWFVMCEDAKGQAFNVFFSKSDMESGKAMRAAPHINQVRAIELCEERARSAAAYASTVKFSRFMDLAVHEYPNGRTRVASSFQAKNAFGLEAFQITCLLDESGLLEATVTE